MAELPKLVGDADLAPLPPGTPLPRAAWPTATQRPPVRGLLPWARQLAGDVIRAPLSPGTPPLVRRVSQLTLVGAQSDQAVERHRRRWHHLSHTASGGKETVPVSLFVISCPTVFSDLLVVLVGNFTFRRKRIFGGLKA
jgi:hypothetical protein